MWDAPTFPQGVAYIEAKSLLESATNNGDQKNKDVLGLTVTSYFETYFAIDGKAFAMVSWQSSTSWNRPCPRPAFLYKLSFDTIPDPVISNVKVTNGVSDYFDRELQVLKDQYPRRAELLTGKY
jgi:hypothetical protein